MVYNLTIPCHNDFIFTFSYHNQRRHQNEWTFFKTTFLYFWKNHKGSIFCMFKTLKPSEWKVLISFKSLFFFLPNVHHSFWKLEKTLTLMIRRAKGFKLMIFLITYFSAFDSNMLLTLKIMDFENVVLIKIIHIYVIEGMNA